MFEEGKKARKETTREMADDERAAQPNRKWKEKVNMEKRRRRWRRDGMLGKGEKEEKAGLS